MQKITGTLIWYYYICPREVWLMAHEINPEQENPLLELGRLIHDDAYPREKKGFETAGIKIDLIKKGEKRTIVGEIKKSSRSLKSATMQLAYYLFRLKEMGIKASGEILFPKEKKRIKVELDEAIERELKKAFSRIEKIFLSNKPPEPKKIRYCRNCAYREFCWA
jgi:CRISPR-associated exonuclease Cas4